MALGRVIPFPEIAIAMGTNSANGCLIPNERRIKARAIPTMVILAPQVIIRFNSILRPK